jgi:DNA invertase Pin-like site-specific DNA recombinase
MCGIFAEFERATITERVNSGLARAKAVKPGGLPANGLENGLNL